MSQDDEANSKRISEIEHSPVFPSVTDISDNYSFIVPKVWKEEESMVTKHDPDESKIKMPQNKSYHHQIDDDIWSDVMELRRRKQDLGIWVHYFIIWDIPLFVKIILLRRNGYQLKMSNLQTIERPNAHARVCSWPLHQLRSHSLCWTSSYQRTE